MAADYGHQMLAMGPEDPDWGGKVRARVITSRADPGLIEGWIDLTRETLVAASKAREGYVGYLAFYDRESGESVAVTLWKDERTEAASDEAAAPSREAFAQAVGADLKVDHYDVAVLDVAN